MTIDSDFLLVNSARLSGKTSINLVDGTPTKSADECREFGRKGTGRKQPNFKPSHSL